MTAPTAPQTPALANLPGVELLQTGEWDISTGTWTVTTDDIAAAVAALDCPAVRRPCLKLGHVDPRFDGEPAVGWIDNLASADSGHMLTGDYVGMPGWLGDVMASAYPDRSVEGQHDFLCQLGHTHPFVLTAVALLGVSAPGIGTLASLQDVAGLYGVAAADQDQLARGTAVAVTIRASKGASLPNPQPLTVAAGVTTEDVRRAYYDDAPWSVWIEEFHLDPLQLIVLDDQAGTRSRVPVVIGAGDGVDAVTFGAAVAVVVRYEDAPADAVAASAARQLIRFASRAESRPDVPVRATSPQEGTGAVAAYTDEQLVQLRTALGLPEDADESAVSSAMIERVTQPPVDPAVSDPAPLPEGTVAIDAATLESLQVAARRGEEAHTRQQREDRAAAVEAAVTDGRIPPARRDHWLAQLAADPGSAEVLGSLAPGLVPVGATASIGHGGDETGSDPLYDAVFGKGAK